MIRFQGASVDKVGGVDLARHVLTHHSTHDLATQVVATAGRPPEEVRDEIMRVIQ